MQTNSITLPPIEVIAAAAAEIAEQAMRSGDRPLLNATNKAQLQLIDGTAPVPTIGGWLLESRTRPGIVHRLSWTHGCSCEAGANGRICWHKQLLVILERAAESYTMPALPSRAEAQAAVDELFA